jgi:hypothetical protein
MKRIAVSILLLTISVWAVAQVAQPATSSGNSGAQAYIVAGPGGLSTNTGTAVILAPPSTPLMVTPEVHLSTVNPSIGASNATPGNSAGAANSTGNIPSPPRIITTVPQFSYAGAGVTQAIAGQEGAPTSAASSATGVGSPVMLVNNAVLFDRGVGSGSSLVAGADTGGRSLGEIARENRQHEAGLNAHLYTNDDINRINAQPGTTVGGMSGAAVGAGNPQQQPVTNNPPAVAQPSTNPAPNPGVSQPVPPTSNTPPLDQSQTEQRQQLPGSGSILPLMAAVGVLATGAGLLAK